MVALANYELSFRVLRAELSACVPYEEAPADTVDSSVI